MPPTWLDNSDGSLGKKGYLKESEEASKEKAYISEKCLKIQTKDNPDTP